MDAELKKKWVEALRSGKYEQGKSYLRQRQGGRLKHCCLGVLCDIIDPEGWVSGRTWRNEKGNQNNQILPIETHLVLGFDCGLEFTLVQMNDEGVPFDEIADEIETIL